MDLPYCKIKNFHLLTFIKFISFHGLARDFCLVNKELKKKCNLLDSLHVFGQLLPFNSQPDLLNHLRDRCYFYWFWGWFWYPWNVSWATVGPMPISNILIWFAVFEFPLYRRPCSPYIAQPRCRRHGVRRFWGKSYILNTRVNLIMELQGTEWNLL